MYGGDIDSFIDRIIENLDRDLNMIGLTKSEIEFIDEDDYLIYLSIELHLLRSSLILMKSSELEKVISECLSAKKIEFVELEDSDDEIKIIFLDTAFKK